MSPRRLDQIVSSLGYCSRKEVRDLVADGRIRVGDDVAKRADLRVDPEQVRLDNEPLEAPAGLLAMLHKPLGYVCTRADGEGPTIYELLPPRWMSRNPCVTSIGRLDKDTSGLLLITDQGDLVHRYTSPKSDCEKVYIAAVDRDLDESLIAIFGSGSVMLRGEEKPCLPAKLDIIGPRTARLTLTEGRYHQVRRMFASQGWHVEKLHRSHFGEYELGDLPEGEVRLLNFH